MKYLLFILMMISGQASAEENGLPLCKAEVNDSFNNQVAQKVWRESFYMGSIGGATQTVLITTSLGNDKIMSLWVREKREANQAGMFSFVDLSSGKDQYLRFYMADGYSVGVTCKWDNNP